MIVYAHQDGDSLSGTLQLIVVHAAYAVLRSTTVKDVADQNRRTGTQLMIIYLYLRACAVHITNCEQAAGL